MTTKNDKYKRIALACQGGGSLGAYHIGAVKSMVENGYAPDLVSGISIGAFTAAIVAGNEPDKVVQKLEEFWDTISWPDLPQMPGAGPEARKMHNKLTSLQGFVFGQPNFFVPRFPHPALQKKGTIAATSFYDTSKLRETLLKFVDFDRINSGKSRLILGATRVKDGELVFFDSKNMTLAPEHVMSSGSMPPGFPGIRIDGDLYWDGGCVSNTPLEGIFKAEPQVDTLCFMVDLFSPMGNEPETMDDVDTRSKDILYTSRTAHHIGHVHHRHNLQKALSHVIDKLPANLKSDPIVKELKDFSNDAKFDIVHIVYAAPEYEVKSKDCEFSKSSIRDRAEHGYNDMVKALEKSPWRNDRPEHVGSRVHKFISGTHVA